MFIVGLNSSVLAQSRSLSLRGFFQPLLCRTVTFGSPLSKMPDIVTGSPDTAGHIVSIDTEGSSCLGGIWSLGPHFGVFSQCPYLVVLRTCTEPTFSKNR